jgi:hypothetical protein
MIETMSQFSIFLPNKPAILATVCRTLAAEKINIIALSMMDASEHGVLRLVARDPAKVRQVLKPLNASLTETKVLAVTMPNRPGALADVCEKLSNNRVQISYLYQTTGAVGGKSIGVLKVDNTAKATKVLEAKRAGNRDMKAKLRNNQRTAVARR